MMFVDCWQTPFWVLGMTLGGLAVHFDRYEALRPLLTATWSDPNGHRVAFVLPNELAEWVGQHFGPSPQSPFRTSAWLTRDLGQREWLVSRYPNGLGARDSRRGRLPSSACSCISLRHSAA